MKGCGQEGRPETREKSGGGAAASRGPRRGAGCRGAGGRAMPPPPGSGAQLRSGPAGRSVTCALPPVAGDHGFAGDGVQPGGALGLLAAGGREGAESARESGRGGAEGAGAAARTPLARPLAGPPRPSGPPRRPRLFT